MKSMIRLTCAVNRVSVADPQKSLEEIKRLLQEAQDSDITVFPRLALCSPSCGSLFMTPQLLDGCEAALEELRALTGHRQGYLIVGLAMSDWGRAASVMAVLYRGELVALIPTLDNPAPFIGSGYSDVLMPPDTLFACGGLRFCVLGCDPSTLTLQGARAAQSGCDLIIVPAYTPIRAGLIDEIEESAANLSASAGCAVAVVNGGVGDTSSPYLYAGFSAVYECGERLAGRIAGYESDLLSVDLDMDVIAAQKRVSAGAAPAHEIEPVGRKGELLRPVRRDPFLPQRDPERYLAGLFDLQVRALVSRMAGTGIKKLVLGVSGGIDSTAALLAAAAAADVLELPRDNIIGVSMPGLGTSAHTRSNADRLMELLGVTAREIPISGAVLAHFKDIGHDGRPDTAFENAQARERTQILMDMANMEGALVVGTGDLSEAALGFSTFGGDQLAHYNVNICITKTVLRELLAFLRKHDVIGGVGGVVGDILATPVSPELLPTSETGEIEQKTEEILGPYELHDFFLYYFVKYRMRPSKILAYARAVFCPQYGSGFIRDKLELFLRRFCAGQFKRACAPDAAAITEVNLCGVSYYIPSDLSAEALIRELD